MILTEAVYLQMCKDLEHAGFGSYGRVFQQLVVAYTELQTHHNDLLTLVYSPGKDKSA